MKEDEYANLDFSDIITDPNLTRREFLRFIGGGIIIFFGIGDGSAVEGRGRGRGSKKADQFRSEITCR